MKRLVTLCALLFLTSSLMGQARGFGNVDTSELKLTSCDFEKDANAMVLFDKTKAYFNLYSIDIVRHKRIKIFNDNGKEYANVRIEFDNRLGTQILVSLEAQTINLDHDKITYTKLDPKQVYSQHTDQSKDATIFSFPDVKPGSVIEYRYTITRHISANFPDWYFQSDIPARYVEFDAMISPKFKFKALTRIGQAFVTDTAIEGGHAWALSNLPSAKDEAYMRAKGDAMASISMLINTFEDFSGKTIQVHNTWDWVGKELVENKGFYKELDQKLSGEDKLIAKADSFKNNDDKIAYLFNTVKKTMSWNGVEHWATKDGIREAWKKRAGNSAEINAIVCHLLKKCGVKAYPMLVSTRDNGLIQPGFVNIFQINNLVTYIPVDSIKHYVLDAADKYNQYDQIPFDLLNSYGLSLNKEANKYDMIYIKTLASTPSRRAVFINADIAADAKMKGTADINSSQYSRTEELELYKKLDEKKYIEYLNEGDNNIRITNLKLENTEIDTLPLHQSFDFTNELTNSDNYIFFSPNLFTSLHINPFLSERRNASVDFGYENINVIVGRYKIPAGYQIESLPKNTNIVMPDKSITFIRILNTEDNYISLRYEIRVKKTIFPISDYTDLHAYYKKMYELMNEQIILKKS